MLLLPLPAYPAYNVITTIDGVDYELVYTYDEHRDLWRLGVNSESGNVVMGHRPLFPFVQMRPNAFGSALDGVFALIAPLPTDDAYEALTEGLWSVVYGDPSEIAGLADSLADLAGDVDDPVVPIEVLYPPNNAILSNPVVTFNGTGPVNQLLFARGESIQIDSMGNWVWTHTFNEPSPVVVFEGESGQRATVRFSIIMQPLTIDPVGEDIDGSMYAFTEDVHVSGSATPNSTISVNGQPVIVGGDGTWSVELTLQAGQSHVITAQSGDGQAAQTSVYVWGEPDVAAIGWWIRRETFDASTLYVDAAATEPAVIGDPIGRHVNKGDLGALGDGVQEVSALRPIWDGNVLTLGELESDDATMHIAPPRAAVAWGRKRHDESNGNQTYRWQVGAGSWPDIHLFIGSGIYADWRIPRQSVVVSPVVVSPVTCFSESADGIVVVTSGGTDFNAASYDLADLGQTPRGEFRGPLRLITKVALSGSIYVAKRELTETEMRHMSLYLEARHGID